MKSDYDCVAERVAKVLSDRGGVQPAPSGRARWSLRSLVRPPLNGSIVGRTEETSLPSVLIEIRRAIPAEEESRLMEAVHSALREAFRILPGDRDVRLIAHEPHRFACPPERTHPELYTHISIDAFAGRSLDAKRALYLGIVKRLEGLGIPKDHVKILLREVPKENWGVRGGQAACDVELGFKVEV